MAEATNHHIYIPTPGDHYSPVTGSAVITLIYEFTRQHIQAGGRAQILVGRKTRHDYPAGEHVVVDFGPLPTIKEKVVDVALGRIGLQRHFLNKSYAPALDVIDPNFAGTIFIQNTPGPTRMFKERLPKAQICVNVHNELFNTYGDGELHRTVDAADLLICNCQFLADQIAERLKHGQEKLRVVHNGVDTTRFVPRPDLVSHDEVTVVFIARMIPTKGADLLVKASVKLYRGGRRFKLRIVGSQGFDPNDPVSPYEVELRKTAAPMGSAVEFLPSMDRHKILEIYQSASVFCAPSNYNEPCTLTVPEAMACGVPVIASKRGGIPEIGRDAVIYFHPPDTDELADRLAELIDSESARREWGLRARARAEEVDWTIQYQVQRQALTGKQPNRLRPGGLPARLNAGNTIPMHIAHMTMPLSRTGSAVTNVVRSLVLCHSGKTSVVTSHNRDVEIVGAENIRADFTGTCPRQYFDHFEMAVDHVFGILNRERPFTGQLPLTAIQMLRADPPDVVFVHEGHLASSALPLFRRWLPETKLFLYVHTRLARSYTRRELRRLLSCTDGIVCVSKYIEDMVLGRLGSPETSIPIHSVINGVDPKLFSPPQQTPAVNNVLFVGQMGEHKGADLAVRALAHVQHPVKLRMVGSSVHGSTTELTAYERKLRKLAASARAGSEVSFEPFQPNDQLPNVYRSAGIVVVPSRFNDPCPLVCLEAMASGCVLVGSNRGGIPAICGDAGLIVEPTPGGIAIALDRLIAEPATYAALRAGARERACELEWSNQFFELTEFVKSVDQKTSRRPAT